MDMTDELDFDLATFRFVNIGESRHRGVEAGLKLYMREQSEIALNQQFRLTRAGRRLHDK